MSAAPLIGSGQQQDQGNNDFNSDLFNFAVDESARGAKPPEADVSEPQAKSHKEAVQSSGV